MKIILVILFNIALLYGFSYVAGGLLSMDLAWWGFPTLVVLALGTVGIGLVSWSLVL